ncbi:MAG: FecR domain-containing protein [Thermoanaerobaculia bacterium]
MAKNRKQSGIDVDWYLISIERLKQIGLVVLLLLLAGAGWWFWHNQKGNPKSNAESAIAQARQALNSVAAAPDFNSHRSEFNRAQAKLDEALAHLNAARFEQARDSAVVSLTISRAALNVTDPESDAQFLTVEGNVEYQKGSSGEWKDAEPRLQLVNGDWVRTGPRASAELIFSNGSLYTVGPSALLEIFSTVNAQTSQKSTVVQMRVGTVEVATAADDTSTVRTPGTQVIVESESTTHVGVDPEKATAVVATRGAASVAPVSGGPPVRLTAGEKISSTPEGTLSPVKKLVMAPALLSPGDNQVFQLSPDLSVDLIWDKREGATGYLLQVSRSRLFSTQEINTKRTKTNAVARATKEGAFYWRVAAIGPDGDVGPFSTFRRFRVSGGGTKPTSDRTPPKLTMKQPFHVGGQYYTIAGNTEPGATVFINDEEVDVESTGAFQKLIALDKIGPNSIIIKAIDAAGNQTVDTQSVIVEE